jgi:hypothetical protein
MLGALGLLVLYAAAIVSVFLPFYWVAWILQKKFNFKIYFLLLISLGASSLIAYIGLFLYYLSPSFIGVFRTITILSMFVSLFILYKQRPKHIRKIPLDISLPIILILMVTTFYGAISLSCSIGGNGFYNYCYVPYATEDHRIPYQYAQNISAGNPTKIEGDWKSTDRPPLQAALYLENTYPLQWLTNDSITTYQIFSMVLQASWILALWVILRIIGGSISLALLGIISSAFTSFIFASTFFVWPKLLAASFFVTAFALIVYDVKKRKTNLSLGHSAIAGTFLALAFLSHSGVSFSIIALFIYLLIRYKNYSFKHLLAIIITMFLLILPWTAYSKLIDHSNDRLLKWHFAGQIEPNDESLEKAIGKAYMHTTLKDYIEAKKDNAEMIIYGNPKTDQAINKDNYLTVLSTKMINVFMLTPGLLITGWVGLIFYRSRMNSNTKKVIKPLLFQFFIGLLVLLLLMYLPFSTIQHQGSYGLNVIMLTLLIIGLSLMNRVVILAVIVTQALLLVVLYTSKPAFYKDYPITEYGMLSLGLIIITILLSAAFYVLHKNKALYIPNKSN